MKYIVLPLLLLLLATPVFAAPNPADFPQTLHVISSFLVVDPSRPIGHDPNPNQELTAIFDGNNYELFGNSLSAISDALASPAGVLPVGDYKARVIDEKLQPNFLLFRTFEILLPNGTHA